MTFEIELDGTRRRVAVSRSGDRWIAEIDGRQVEVSIVERGASRAGAWSMLVGGARSYEIAFEPTTDGGLVVHVNGVAVPLTVRDQSGAPHFRAKSARRRGTDGAGDARPHTVVAPMPGRIVKVLVKPDEAVAARQPLVVVEAMKMENELRAPRAGIVADIRVAEGASVEANTVLMVLK